MKDLKEIIKRRLENSKGTLIQLNENSKGAKSFSKSILMLEELLKHESQFWLLESIFEELFEIDEVREILNSVVNMDSKEISDEISTTSECPICNANKYGMYGMEEIIHDDDCAYLNAIKLKETLKKDK